MNNHISTLAICLEQTKITLSWVAFLPDTHTWQGQWTTQPLYWSQDKQGSPLIFPDLKQVIISFVDEVGLEIHEVQRVAIAVEDFIYAYSGFVLGLGAILTHLESIFSSEQLYFSDCHSQLSPIRSLKEHMETASINYICTGFVGSGFLGSRLMKMGLVLDIGEQLTRIIPIIDSQPDPAMRHPLHLQQAYAVGKRLYIGLLTPIREILNEIVTEKGRYQLCLSDFKVLDACKMVNDPMQTGQNHCEKKLAASIGLDMSLLSPAECHDIARQMYRQTIQKLVTAIDNVVKISRLTEERPWQALILGKGQNILAKAALKAYGLKDPDILLVNPDHQDLHWSHAGAAYGLALMAIEALINEPIELELSV